MYELSHIGASQYFAITAVPISIQNNAQSGECAGLNELQDQPQPDFPPPPNPFANASLVSPTPTATSSGMQTIFSSSRPSSYYSMPSVLPTLTYTISNSSVQWPLTVTVSDMGPVVVVPTGYGASGSITLSDILTDTSTPTHTLTEGDETIIVVVGPTATPPPVTVVLASVQTLTVTQTEPGVSTVVTKTYVNCAKRCQCCFLTDVSQVDFIIHNHWCDVSTIRSTGSWLLAYKCHKIWFIQLCPHFLVTAHSSRIICRLVMPLEPFVMPCRLIESVICFVSFYDDSCVHFMMP